MANSPGVLQGRRPLRRAWLLLAWLALTACEGPPARVVLISIDTLRADHVGVYGAGPDATPVLDQLSERGVRFETAIAPTPLTLPSHTTLLTGLDPLEHGVHHNGSFRLTEDFETLAERLREAGFATAAFVGAHVLDRVFGLSQGFDVYDDQMTGAERPADAVVDAALAWLATAPERFFLWVHLYDPHAFYEPPPRFRDRASAYAGEIAFADEQVGRLLSALGERFDASGSLVVLASDHGEGLGAHAEQAHGFGLYDATQRVPLLFAGPGVPAGRVVEAPVRLVDVTPTILALAGLPALPDAVGHDLTVGRDLTEWMRGAGEPLPPAYLETFATRLDLGSSPLLGLRTPRYKYIHSSAPELYDLEADPREEHDLAAERGALSARLERALERRIEGAPPVRPNLELGEVPRAMLESLGYVVAEPPAEPIPVEAATRPAPQAPPGEPRAP